jgi:hypothetical protein
MAKVVTWLAGGTVAITAVLMLSIDHTPDLPPLHPLTEPTHKHRGPETTTQPMSTYIDDSIDTRES